MRFLCLLLVFLSSLTSSVYLRGGNKSKHLNKSSKLNQASSHNLDDEDKVRGKIEELRENLDELDQSTTFELRRYTDLRENRKRDVDASTYLSFYLQARTCAHNEINQQKKELEALHSQGNDDEKKVRERIEKLRKDMDELELNMTVSLEGFIDTGKPGPEELNAITNLESLKSARQSVRKEINSLEEELKSLERKTDDEERQNKPND